MKLFKCIYIIILVLCPIVGFSQPGGGGPGGGGDPDVPLGGIELLLIAGGALGVRKLVNKRK